MMKSSFGKPQDPEQARKALASESSASAAATLNATPHSIADDRCAEEMDSSDPADEITPRERQVLALIASGKSSKELAAELGIAFGTAACHRYRLQQKLKARNTADLTRAAMRMGLIEL